MRDLILVVCQNFWKEFPQLALGSVLAEEIWNGGRYNVGITPSGARVNACMVMQNDKTFVLKPPAIDLRLVRQRLAGRFHQRPAAWGVIQHEQVFHNAFTEEVRALISEGELVATDFNQIAHDGHRFVRFRTAADAAKSDLHRQKLMNRAAVLAKEQGRRSA
jgi:hypothetical protein